MTPATYPVLSEVARAVLPEADAEQVEALVRAGARAGEDAAAFRIRCVNARERLHRETIQKRASLEQKGSPLANKYASEYARGRGGWR
jgi:hypothetical protein